MDPNMTFANRGSFALLGEKMARREFQDPSVLRRMSKRGEVYYLRYRVNGPWPINGAPRQRKEVWKTLGLCSEISQRKAERLKAEILREVNAQVYNRPGQTQFGEFLKTFEAQHLPTLSEPTQKTYRQWLKNYIEPAFKGKRLCDVGREEIQEFLLALPVASATRASIRGTLASVWSRAKAWLGPEVDEIALRRFQDRIGKPGDEDHDQKSSQLRMAHGSAIQFDVGNP